MKYIVTMPDGTTATRESNRVYTHAVLATIDRRSWNVFGFCESFEESNERAARHRQIAPCEEVMVVEVREVDEYSVYLNFDKIEKTSPLMGVSPVIAGKLIARIRELEIACRCAATALRVHDPKSPTAEHTDEILSRGILR